MPTVIAGRPWNVSVQWVAYQGGPAQNVSGLEITITPVAGGAAVVGPTSSGITNPATGTYVYPVDSADDLTPGDYLVSWETSDGDTAFEVVTVQAASVATWATAAQVEDVTGVTVTEAQLNQANDVISIYVERQADLDQDSISPRDLHWLNRAVCWQAAWQVGQPGYELRNNAGNVAQDGTSVSREAEHYTTLAPMAARALRNISWIGSRTVRHGSTLTTTSPPLYDFLMESSDQRHTWAPLEIS